MFKRLVLFCMIWYVCGSVVKQQELRAVFGVQISFTTNSQMYTIVAYTDNGRALTNKKIMTKDEFVRFASGHWPSIYNPKKINLLELNNISCGLTKDSITKKYIPSCSPLDSLWKIRFSDYPYNNGKEKGWSNNLHKPSNAQAVYLYKNYNVYDIDFSFFLDSNFWKIMRDVQNPEWIKNYRSL